MKKLTQVYQKTYILIVLFIWLLPASVGYPADGQIAGKIINCTGDIFVAAPNTNSRKKALPGIDLFPQDTIVTGHDGWAAVLMSDGTLVQINRNTIFVLKKVASSAGWFTKNRVTSGAVTSKKISRYEIKSGEAWFRNKNRNMVINIETPTVTAGIRGTEINITVDNSLEVTITILEGLVVARNAFGAVSGISGEVIKANQGAIPIKYMVLEPENAVQWTITIPAPVVKYLLSIIKVKPELIASIRSRKLIESQTILQGIVSEQPENAPAFTWLSLVQLYRGKRAQALESAKKAVQLSNGAIPSLIILSYIYQAVFNLEKAMDTLNMILEKDPENILALTNKARLLFGSRHIKKALHYINLAYRHSPDNPDVLTLKGFISLAMQQYQNVETSFKKAIAQNPHMGEAYMGLAIFHMRQSKIDLALKEMATAVLLEPRNSLFVSYWAKMLYQIKRFDRAQELLELAMILDPNDPTPHLYQSIILRDLNYSGQAIDALNKAIDLNDKRAVYRSRFLLDQDLAVKNVDLSIIYNQLGLSAWAGSKALESVKADYNNSSAHIFLGGALSNMEGRFRAATGETLLSNLLQPANINALNTFQDYTSFFDQPAVSLIATGMVGNQDTYLASLLVSGAYPAGNFAYNALGSISSTDGWRGNNTYEWTGISGSFKWDPTLDDGFFIYASHADSTHGNRFDRQYEYDAPSLPDDYYEDTPTSLKAGYHHKFSPDLDILLFTSYRNSKPYYFYHSSHDLEEIQVTTLTEARETHKIDDYFFQGQFLYAGQNHQVIAGAFYENFFQELDTDLLHDYYLTIDGQSFYLTSNQEFHSAEKNDYFYSIYVQDTWEILSSLRLESGLYWNFMKQQSVYGGSQIEYHDVDPRIGLSYRMNAQNIFRIAAFRYIVPTIVEKLDPADIAGIPIYRNNYYGTVSKETDFSWEHEWENAYSFFNIFYMDSKLPDAYTTGSYYHSTATGIEQIFNILATDWAGVTLGYRFMDVDNEFSFEKDRYDHKSNISFTLNFPSGFYAGLSETYRYLNMKNHTTYKNESIWITDVRFGYKFPDKKGGVNLDVYNLFDSHFNWIVDDFVFSGRDPGRQILLSLYLNF